MELLNSLYHFVYHIRFYGSQLVKKANRWMKRVVIIEFELLECEFGIYNCAFEALKDYDRSQLQSLYSTSQRFCNRN